MRQVNINSIFAGIIIGVGLFVSYTIIIQAQTAADIVYPVKELNNCKNQTECRAFCDEPDNIKPCVAFAEKHNLMSKEEIKRARAVAEVEVGPGGCRGRECETFCDDPKNIEVCLDFAEKNNLIDEEELKEARQVAKVLKEGAQLPGGCRNKSDCEVYCDEPSHINECLDFADKAGFLPPEELKEARQAAQAFAKGIKPPGNCRGKKQCDAYCSEPTNMEECLNFAEAAGFIPPEEAAEARRIMPLMMKGEMPGGCKTKEQCENYCADEANFEECTNFAIKAGFIEPEEAEIIRKTGGKGPGGCKGKEECEDFCNQPQNSDACFQFAKEHGLISEEDMQEMQEGMERMREGLEDAPPGVEECLRKNLGPEVLEKIKNSTLTPSQKIGDQFRNCFEEFMKQEMMGPSGRFPSDELEEDGSEDFEKMMPQGASPREMMEEMEERIRDERINEYREDIENEMMEKMMPEFAPPGFQPEKGLEGIPEQYRQMIPEEYKKMMEQGE